MISRETLAIFNSNLFAAAKVNMAFQRQFARIGSELTVREPIDWANSIAA